MQRSEHLAEGGGEVGGGGGGGGGGIEGLFLPPWVRVCCEVSVSRASGASRCWRCSMARVLGPNPREGSKVPGSRVQHPHTH